MSLLCCVFFYSFTGYIENCYWNILFCFLSCILLFSFVVMFIMQLFGGLWLIFLFAKYWKCDVDIDRSRIFFFIFWIWREVTIHRSKLTIFERTSEHRLVRNSFALYSILVMFKNARRAICWISCIKTGRCCFNSLQSFRSGILASLWIEFVCVIFLSIWRFSNEKIRQTKSRVQAIFWLFIANLSWLNTESKAELPIKIQYVCFGLTSAYIWNKKSKYIST